MQRRDERTPGEAAVIGGLMGCLGDSLGSSPQTNALAGLGRLNQGRETKERGSGIALASLSVTNRGVPSTSLHISIE